MPGASRRLGQVAELRARGEAEDRGIELLTRFGLADKAGDYPDSLSGGQQQRVAVVRALGMQPELMLFDEVTSALEQFPGARPGPDVVG